MKTKKKYYYVFRILDNNDYEPIAVVDSYVAAYNIINTLNAFNLYKDFEYAIDVVSPSSVSLIKDSLKK